MSQTLFEREVEGVAIMPPPPAPHRPGGSIRGVVQAMWELASTSRAQNPAA
ncbi:MAG TPA: hypothetical protein VHI73_02865 [Solirubrobacteraceae bacterium]|nr:hypothetical protein [Solirubrobacteraceae bacterium]